MSLMPIYPAQILDLLGQPLEAVLILWLTNKQKHLITSTKRVELHLLTRFFLP